MAESLLSLLSPGTMKHVVPWKTRLDFLSVYRDLYSDDVNSQESAIGRIMAWKARAGNKLSVAIESSASLMQVRLQHLQAEKDKKLRQTEHQLCSSYSLALIRFVNHTTEKAQNKALAQPVHLVAREFGIPEWIVRLRHDATHSALPCLDTLASGTLWALNYLRQNFWEVQNVNNNPLSSEGKSGVDNRVGSAGKDDISPKTGDIRKLIFEYQKLRFKTYETSNQGKAESDCSSILGKLQQFMLKNKLKFVKCFLEDGFLISTEEQLQAFGLDQTDILKALPPTIPMQVAFFWRPLLKCMSSAGLLPLLLHTALYSVTSDQGLHNYQLVAWIAYILSNSSSSESCNQGRRKRVRKKDAFVKTSQPIPTRTLLSACLQNLNTLTAHLLTYLIDVENVGQAMYDRLREQLQMTPSFTQEARYSAGSDGNTESAEVSSSATDSDADTDSALQDRKSTGVEKDSQQLQISTNVIENIQAITQSGHVAWNVCTDLVDWSTVPFGILPDPVRDATDSSSDGGEDIEDPNNTSQSSKQSRRRRRRGSRGNDDDDEDEEDSDDAEEHSSPKQSKLIVTDELLL